MNETLCACGASHPAGNAHDKTTSGTPPAEASAACHREPDQHAAEGCHSHAPHAADRHTHDAPAQGCCCNHAPDSDTGHAHGHTLSSPGLPGLPNSPDSPGSPEASQCCSGAQLLRPFNDIASGQADSTPDHGSCCGHDHSHDQHSCCGHDHKPAQAVDYTTLGQASATRALYRIMNMDCPMEEALIRKKLGTMDGITGLEFNLMQRVLTVSHALSSTEPIEAALRSIDMTPEPLSGVQGAVALFAVSGMDCPDEERLIRSKLSGMPGMLGLECNLVQRTLTVRHEPSALPAIAEALFSLDLDARLMEAGAENRDLVPAPVIPWRKLAVAGIFAALSEMFELMHAWHAAPFGYDISSWSIGTIAFPELASVLLAIAAILLGGLDTYKKGWIAVKNRNLNINALMSVAVTGAALIGQYPEAAMVMVLFNLAEALEAKSLDRARNAIRELVNLTPERATVRRPDGTWQEVDIRQVAIGTHVRVRPGERVALDGVVIEGQSTINQAPITGESLPVEKHMGDTVYAGTINESGSFIFRVTAGATNSTLARIIHAVEEAQGTRAPTQRFVDQFARYYTPGVFLAAILVAIIPPLFMGGAWHESIYTALVMLVIGCPCALVISTPVSIVSGMAAATRQGILVKGGAFLEQGRLLRWLALDKTGTITHGKPRQTDVIPVTDNPAAASLAASLASRSDHPVSRAIAEYAARQATPLREVALFTAVPGQGVQGEIDGVSWFLGNHRMLKERNHSSPELETRITALESEGKSVVVLANQDGPVALFAVADTLRESSVTALEELRKLGVRTIMLTGDNEHTAKAIAGQVKVDSYKGNLLPEDKLAMVEELLSRGGKVGMVGDGINDAPALARADIGFAMAAAGTDTAIETADVALMDDDLGKIAKFIRLSRSTYAILVQNITLALGVKAVFLALTLMGQATMWMAVFADVGTSLLVVANGLRAMRK